MRTLWPCIVQAPVVLVSPGPHNPPTASVGTPLQNRYSGPLGLWSVVLKVPTWGCCSISHWMGQQRTIIWPELLFRICDSQLEQLKKKKKKTARLPGPFPVSFLITRWPQDLFITPANPGYLEAATLLGNIWDKGMFSWACINYELDSKIATLLFLRHSHLLSRRC